MVIQQGIVVDEDSLLLAVRHLTASGAARTRKELAEQLGVAKSTISENVSKLLAMGILRETTEKVASGAGRRASILTLAKDGPATLAIDVGVASLDTAIITSDGNIEKRRHQIHEGDLRPEEVLSEAVKPYLEDLEQVATIGVGFAGPVDTDWKTLRAASSLPSWSDFDVSDWAKNNLGINSFAVNDANATAWAEHFTLMKGQSNLQSTTTIALKLASGMGMGIIVRGKLHTGADGAAGEISHVQMDLGAKRQCLCGRKGCIETIVSGKAILREVQEIEPQIKTIENLVEQIRCGNLKLLELCLDKAELIGICLAMLTNFLNPHRVILSGPLFTIDAFFKRTHAALLEAAHPSVTKTMAVLPSQLGPDAVLTGIGLLGVQRTLIGGIKC